MIRQLSSNTSVRRNPRSRQGNAIYRRRLPQLMETLEPRLLLSLSGSNFESGDGNLLVTAVGNHDWVDAPNLVVKADLPSGSDTDDAFASGSDESQVGPTLGFGSIPGNKDDLSRFYVGYETAANDHVYVYLAWERYATNGSANIDFEFNQSETMSANGVMPVRTPGDFLISYDFGGSGAVTLTYRTWQSDGTWSAEIPLSAVGFAEGTVNTMDVTDPIPDPENPAPPVTLAANRFGEAAIDLTAAGIFSSTQLRNFGYVYAKSRSSGSFSSSLKDFIRPVHINITNGVVISGHKYNDLNDNGAWDTGEPGLADWPINLDAGNDGTVDKAILTNANGYYKFLELPGTYKVSEGSLPGWTPTAPTSGTFTLTRSQGVTQDFFNFQGNTISGIKYKDINADGIIAGDPVFSGVTIKLYRDANGNGVFDGDTLFASAVTNAAGEYSFLAVPTGTFFIVETSPTGYTQTFPVNPTTKAPLYYTVTPTASGATLTGFNFDNAPNITIAGRKFTDVNGDAAVTGDPGLGGVTIQLYKETGAAAGFDATDSLVGTVTTATTGDIGSYAFRNLEPGTYYVQEIVPVGYIQMLPLSPDYYTVTSAGNDSLANNFANFQLGSISGYKYTDITGNGITSDDTGLPGVTINLYKDADGNHQLTAADTFVKFATTGAGGAYSFANLGPGEYFVQEIVPPGYIQIAPASPNYRTVVMTSGLTAANVNFANFQLGSISGTKYTDVTGNGITSDDTGLSGVTIRLYRDANGNGVLDDAQTDFRVTGPGGAYSFLNLGPGRYFLREDVPPGYIQTAPSSPAFRTVVMTTGLASIANNFANFQFGAISGVKYLDLLGDGITGDDTPMAGVTIKLFRDADNTHTLSAGDTLVGTVTTSAGTGAYAFNNLGPGQYFVAETVPAGYIQTVPTANGCYTVTMTSGLNQTGENFANFRLMAISGTKILDRTGDGFSADDTPLSGVTINLVADTNGSGKLDSGDQTVKTTTTAPNGAYAFASVAPGVYFLTETLASGYIQIAPSSPDYYTLTASSSGDITGKDFANFRLMTISGQKFNDITGNGLTSNDTPLGGVTINLFKESDGTLGLTASDTLVGTVTTASGTGAYAFKNLGPGQYYVVETVPPDNIQTAPAAPGIYSVLATSQGDVAHRDFANFERFYVGGIKFEDHNGNGVQETGDQPLQGWTITLSDGTTTLTSVTDANGAYAFNNLGPGVYTLAEQLKPGWTCTLGAAGYTITGTSGGDFDRDFGNFQNYTISGMKFQDHDGNGLKDTGDEGLEGWTILLDGKPAAVTAADGTYLIADVGPGTHTLSEQQKTGWTQTTPNYTIVGSSGVNQADKDFGNFKNVTIMGQKFLDGNFNGFRDPGEITLNGWVIQAVNSKGQIIASATTQNIDLDGNGTIDPATEQGVYMLSVGPGSLTIREVLKNRWVQFYPAAGTYSVTVGGSGLQSGTVATGYDFGNAPLIDHNSKTHGFWDNKNGQETLESQGMAGALATLNALHLVNESGAFQQFGSYADIRNFFRKARSVNAAYMLSVQTATLALSVYCGFVDNSTLVYAPSLLPYSSQLGGILSPTGVISVGDLIATASLSVLNNPLTKSAGDARTFQGALESVIDDCNNNQNFLT